MQEFLYQDSSFDLTNSEKYNLSIQASLDGFSILLQNDENHLIDFIGYIPYKLSGDPGLLRKLPELLNEKDILSKPFKKTTIILESKQVKIVPDHLVNEKNLKYFFNLKPKETKRRSFITTTLTASYQSIFGYNSEIIDFFERNLTNCAFIHETSELLKLSLKQNIPDKVLICCLFHTDFFYLFATKDDDILFFNSFSFQSPTDILFYLLSVLKLFNEETVVMKVAGNIDEQSAEYAIIRKYFSGILLWKPDHIKLTANQINGFQPHRIAPLLSSVVL
jgi:hypothetical protein